MLEEDLFYTLALQRVKGIGDINAKKLIAHCGSPKQVFKSKKYLLEKINGIGSFTIRNLNDSQNLKAAENELKYLKTHTIAFRYFLDKDYPEGLKHCVDAPILLFTKGNINLNKAPLISIVGTRNITSYGRSFCEDLIENLKEYKPIIVSGFAYGTDITAHKSAIKQKLQTIGVLAHGFEKMYPKSHIKYVEEVAQNGGFITDFWHNDALIRENFLKRNRIIAGLTEATIIIESAEKGGSLVTADIASSYNREVLAVPGRATDTYSKGCNTLIKQNKAAILTSATDVVELLNWKLEETKPKSVQKQLFVELNNEEQKVYDFLIEKGKTQLDFIALQNQLPIHKTSTLLFNLEMKGVVKPLPGKLFEAI
ncbi:MAG TPA: DNA-processing protein DprA [Flavobacteriaceae bacterium]|nr:DNA-processing protein DprA [Flavobacteriaceae bacterium]